jgi:hypothetical protein
MVKKILLTITSILMILPLTFALSTQINIKTLPHHEVQVTASDATISAFSALDKTKKISDQFGDMIANLSIEKPFNLVVFVKKDGTTIITKKYLEGYSPGENVNIEIAPEGFKFLENPAKTKSNETEKALNVSNEMNVSDSETDNIEEADGINEEESRKTAGITGKVIENTKTSKNIYFGIGGFLLLVVIALIIVKMLLKHSASKNIKDPFTTRIKLEKAERELQKAQSEINQIKNKEKVAEAEKKLEEDKKELERLRKGEE